MHPDFCLSLSLVCCLAALERKTITVRSVVFRHSPASGFPVPRKHCLVKLQSQEVGDQQCQGSEQAEGGNTGKSSSHSKHSENLPHIKGFQNLSFYRFIYYVNHTVYRIQFIEYILYKYVLYK